MPTATGVVRLKYGLNQTNIGLKGFNNPNYWIQFNRVI